MNGGGDYVWDEKFCFKEKSLFFVFEPGNDHRKFLTVLRDIMCGQVHILAGYKANTLTLVLFSC